MPLFWRNPDQRIYSIWPVGITSWHRLQLQPRQPLSRLIHMVSFSLWFPVPCLPLESIFAFTAISCCESSVEEPHTDLLPEAHERFPFYKVNKTLCVLARGCVHTTSNTSSKREELRLSPGLRYTAACEFASASWAVATMVLCWRRYTSGWFVLTRRLKKVFGFIRY